MTTPSTSLDFGGTSASSANIRRATRDDVADVVRFAISLGRQHEGYAPRRFPVSSFSVDGDLEPVYTAFFHAQLDRADARVLVAELDTVVVGYVFVRLAVESFLDLSGPAGWIHDVMVADSVRTAGVGDALLSEALATLRQLGATTIRLVAAPENTRARAFFERRGFRPTLIEYSQLPNFERSA